MNKDFYIFTGSTVGVVPIISRGLYEGKIDYDSVEQRRGFNITIVTTAKTPAEGRFLLTQLGFPFAKSQ